MELKRNVGGRVMSSHPLVTFSKRSQDVPVGIASVRPDFFRGRDALHLIGFSFSNETPWEFEAFSNDIQALAKELPTNHFAVAANTEFEAYLLSTKGIPSMLANQSVFLDETAFRPLTDPPEPQLFDAIYNARLDPQKRHALAREVKSLALLYMSVPGDPHFLYDEVRQQLPHARFLNHEAGDGAYQILNVEQSNRLMNQARVGLALSAVEGTMRAAFEYLLCGLPVVSTRSIGGRDRFFMAPFAKITGDDPGEIAAAVTQLVDRQLDKRAIRAHTMRILKFERHNYLIALNKLIKATLGVDNAFPSFAPFLGRGLERFRSADDFIAEIEQ